MDLGRSERLLWPRSTAKLSASEVRKAPLRTGPCWVVAHRGHRARAVTNGLHRQSGTAGRRVLSTGSLQKPTAGSDCDSDAHLARSPPMDHAPRLAARPSLLALDQWHTVDTGLCPRVNDGMVWSTYCNALVEALCDLAVQVGGLLPGSLGHPVGTLRFDWSHRGGCIDCDLWAIPTLSPG
jgi:hypothetical protein